MAFEHISCSQLQERLTTNDETPLLVDIRDRASFDQAHIQDAVHVDNSSVDDFLRQADKLKPLVVYCYHGNSSRGAADYFNQQGFSATFSLDGGYEAWKTL